MGDRLLKRVAQIAENMAEGCGVAARIGPDIFAIFFTEVAKREQIYQNHNNISQMVEKAGQELEMEDSVLSTAWSMQQNTRDREKCSKERQL